LGAKGSTDRRMGEVWLFLKSVWQYWWAIVGGGAVTMSVAAYERKKKKDVPWPWLVALMAVALLISCFLAWREVHHQSQSQQRDVATLEGDKKALQARLEDRQGEIDRLRDELVRRPFPAKVQIIGPAAAEPKPLAPRELIVTPPKPVVSDQKDAPEAREFTIQTTARIQPTLLAVKCDGEIARGAFRMGDMSYFLLTREGYGEKRTVYWSSFQQPPFDPATPLIVTLMAKKPIRVLKVERRSSPPGP